MNLKVVTTHYNKIIISYYCANILTQNNDIYLFGVILNAIFVFFQTVIDILHVLA